MKITYELMVISITFVLSTVNNTAFRATERYLGGFILELTYCIYNMFGGISGIGTRLKHHSNGFIGFFGALSSNTYSVNLRIYMYILIHIDMLQQIEYCMCEDISILVVFEKSVFYLLQDEYKWEVKTSPSSK